MSPRLILETPIFCKLIVLAGNDRERVMGHARGHDVLVKLEEAMHSSEVEGIIE